MYILKSLAAALQRHDRRVRNTFDCAVLTLTVESGQQHGEWLARQWYKMPKKVYANRYSTDCLAGIFERRAEQNAVGLDDLPEYAGGRATWDELQNQNSFFQRDMASVDELTDEQTGESFSVPAPRGSADHRSDLGYDPMEILRR